MNNLTTPIVVFLDLRTSQYGNDCAHITLTVETVAEGKLRGFSETDCDLAGLMLRDTIFGHIKSNFPMFKAVFMPYKVDEREADRIVKVLRRVNRKMDVLCGENNGWGQQLINFCKAIGAKQVWYRDGHNTLRPYASIEEAAATLDQRVADKLANWYAHPWLPE